MRKESRVVGMVGWLSPSKFGVGVPFVTKSEELLRARSFRLMLRTLSK